MLDENNTPVYTNRKFSYANITTFMLLAIFIIQPLVIGPLGYKNITQIKMYTYMGIMAVTILLFLIRFAATPFLRTVTIRTERPKPFWKAIRPYEYCIIAYVLIMILSTCLSEFPRHAIWGASARNEGLVYTCLYLLSVVLIGRFYKPQPKHLAVLCGVAVLVSLYGICQYYGFDFLHLNPEAIANVQGPDLTYIATMSNRNMLSTYLCIAYCVCTVLFTRGEELTPKKQLLILGMGWIIFYMLILGQSESGYVGIFVAFLLLFPIFAKDAKEVARFFFFVAGCALLIGLSVLLHKPDWGESVWTGSAPILTVAAVVCLIVAVLFYKIPTLTPISRAGYLIRWYLIVIFGIAALLASLPHLAEISNHKAIIAANEIILGNYDESLGSNRIYIWKRAMELLPGHRLIGHGPDTFHPVFFMEYGIDTLLEYNVQYDKAHNEYIQTLVCTGVLGLISLLSLYASLLFPVLRQNKRESLAVGLALSCFLVQAIFNFSTPFAHPIVWAFWGIAAACIYRKEPAWETAEIK